MGRVKAALALLCHACPLCAYARRRPDSRVGRILHHPLHAEHCPLWILERERYGRPESGGAPLTTKGGLDGRG